jgi:two-component system CheB/CheR fusion protein
MGGNDGAVERLRDQLALVTRLHRLATDHLVDGDLPRLLDAAVREALAITGADRGCVQILHGGGGGLRLAGQEGLVRPFVEYVANLRVGLGGHRAGFAERPWFVEDVATDEALAGSADREALLAAEVRALHAVPLVASDGRVVGRLSALHRHAPERGPPDPDALARVAELCAAATVHAVAAASSRPASDAALGARLADAEELFRNTVENLPVSMLLVDRAARVLYVDPALGEMVRGLCGLGPAALVGKPGAEIWPPFVWDPFEAALRAAVATGQRQTFDLQFAVPSGEVNHRHWIVVPLAGPDGEVHRVLGINHDVTAERRLLDELREADRRKGEFIGVLSHELRNPLSAIRSSLYAFDGEDGAAGEGARARRAAARSLIDRQVRHLVRLVEDLLDVTRIAQNKIQLQRRPVDLARLVREAIADNRAQLEHCGVRLDVRVEPEPLAAEVDPIRVAQVVGNLMSNAAKFTPAGGAATVSLEARGDAAVLTVADTGRGIEASLLPRLFEPFVQSDRAHDGDRGGLGLGLALVRRLAELHGGQVTAASDGPGTGATFVVRLPLGQPAGLTATAPAPPAVAARRRRVLVVDDNRDVADGLELALARAGHEVAIAYDGQSALALARAFKADCVLCDIGMPDMDGYEVARAFRSDPQLRGVFLVALTGYAQAVDRERARRMGFDEHVAKPADMERLQALLAR